jgi:hypothetical protein
VKIRAEDWRRMAAVAAFSAPAIAFMAFDFVFPNVSSPSLNKNFFVAFMLSILFGMPSGYLTRRTDLAIVTVLVYVFLGYVLAIVAYMAPFLFYDFRVVFPDMYVMFFLNLTVIPLMLFALGGFIGVVLGQMLGESFDREETAQSFSRGHP